MPRTLADFERNSSSSVCTFPISAYCVSGRQADQIAKLEARAGSTIDVGIKLNSLKWHLTLIEQKTCARSEWGIARFGDKVESMYANNVSYLSKRYVHSTESILPSFKQDKILTTHLIFHVHDVPSDSLYSTKLHIDDIVFVKHDLHPLARDSITCQQHRMLEAPRYVSQAV